MNSRGGGGGDGGDPSNGGSDFQMAGLIPLYGL